MDSSVYTALLSILVLVFMAGVLIFIALRSKQEEIQKEWLFVLEKLRLRLDKLPHILELILKQAPAKSQLCQELIELKSQSWSLKDCTQEKIQLELSISQKITDLFLLGKAIPELSRNTVFLATKHELLALNKEISDMLKNYNSKVERYNNSFKFLGAIFLLFGFKKLLIFQWENKA